MALTGDPVVIANAVIAVLEGLEGEDSEPLLKSVYYGDEQSTRRIPSAAVVIDDVQREIARVSMPQPKLETTVKLYVYVYFGQIGASTQTKIDTDNLAFAVERGLMSDPKLGGLVIDSLVTKVEPTGVAPQGQNYVKAARLTWMATTHSFRGA